MLLGNTTLDYKNGEDFQISIHDLIHQFSLPEALHTPSMKSADKAARHGNRQAIHVLASLMQQMLKVLVLLG